MATAIGLNMVYSPRSPQKTYQVYEWLCHSNFSFLIGAAHPEEYVDTAIELGLSGIGLCDYDGLYGIVRAHRRMQFHIQKAHQKVHQKVFYGSELHLKKDHHLPLVFQDTLVLYALNLRGYYNLCRILSYSHKESKREAAIAIHQLVSFDLTDLVCLLPMRGLIRTGAMDDVRQRWSMLKDIMPERVYPVISRHMNPSEDCWIRPTLQVVEQLGLPVLLSQDCYFHHPQNKMMSDLLQAIRLNQTLDQSVAHMFVNTERCLKSPGDLLKRYASIPQYRPALQHGHELAQRFDFELSELRYQYPKEMIPEGHTAISFLDSLVWSSAITKFGSPVPSQVAQLLAKEMSLVETLAFADYFLTVWDIVRWARQQGILCQGRGSAANSVICYLLNITAVDPTKFDLLFERFISAERGDPPDIDVDFEHERREEVIQYIYEHYGRGRAAMVANVITFRRRGASRAVGQALGVPAHLLDKSSKGVVDPSAFSADPVHALWSQLTQRLKGYPRHMGIHSGGFVLTDQSIDRFVPQEPATMPGRTVVQWAKDDLEALGFFKIDILALGILTAIRKAASYIKDHYSVTIDLATIPQDDPKTYAMIQRADTVGTFQIESRAQMSMLPRLKPRCFYDLVVEVGIIRPGPIQGGLIHPFLRRRQGLEPITYAHPRLVPILERTLGIPIFQEQVMRIAMAVGNFSAGEADQLRKKIGSWALNKDMSPMIKQLEAGMRSHGIEEAFIRQTLEHLRGFADYGFPESHAVSFALLSYASSWIKCHYPDAFFAALLNSQPMGFYAPHTLLQTASNAGVTIRPVCVNHSQWETALEPDPGGRYCALRLGLHMVRGLRKQGAVRLLKKRHKTGCWTDLHRFMNDSPLYKGDLTALAAANALASLGLDRRAALWLAESAPFAPLLEEDLVEAFAEEPAFVRAERDFEAFATTLGDHPTKIIKSTCWHYPVELRDLVASHELDQKPNNVIIKTFGMILLRQSPPTAKGMVFFTLEDEYGFINLAFTPQTYKRFAHCIQRQGFLLTEGHLQKGDGNHSLLVKRVFEPTLHQATVIDLKRY